MRQIVLDTETTGLDHESGHRVIEIGCVEIVERRLTGNHWHQYINHERDIDEAAFEVHGIDRRFLEDKPVFADVAAEFVDFVAGAELIIHNAPFDLGFLDAELKRCGHPRGRVSSFCGVIDSLELAQQRHPGARNNLDALCKRYAVDNSNRELHGALLDAEILADVYLVMTGGQTDLGLAEDAERGGSTATTERVALARSGPLPVIEPSAEELAAHEAYLEQMREAGACLWPDEVAAG